LNRDAVAVLEGERGKPPRYCFTYKGKPIRWQVSNSGLLTGLAKAGIKDFRFHDLRHTWPLGIGRRERPAGERGAVRYVFATVQSEKGLTSRPSPCSCWW